MDNSLEGELPSAAVGSDLEPLDPVFSPNCMIEGVKHAGKARRGDGNDLTACEYQKSNNLFYSNTN